MHDKPESSDRIHPPAYIPIWAGSLLIPSWLSAFVVTHWRSLRVAFVCCLWIAAGYVIATTVDATIRSMSPIVFWDGWQWIGLLESWIEKGFTWSSLLAVQNEHQLAFGRILLLADYFISSATNWSLILLNLTLYAGTTAILVKLFVAATERARVDRIDLAAFAAFVSIVMFAAANLANLSWNFSVHFILGMVLIVFAVLAAISTVRAAQHEKAFKTQAWFAATVAIALIASFSAANGILIWPIVLGFFFFAGIPKKNLLVFALISTATAVFYILTLKLNSGMNADPRATWHNPATYLVYLPYFFGNAIVDEQHAAKVAFVLGWIGLFGSMAAGLAFIRQRKSWDAYQLGLASILAFELVTGVMIDLSRQNWGGQYGMIVDRYRLPNAVFWSATLALFWSVRWARSDMKETARVAAATLMACVTVGVVANQRNVLERYFDRYERREIAADALRMQVTDKLVLKEIMWPDEAMTPLINFVRDRRLSVFADGRFELVGKPLSDVYRTATGAKCDGRVLVLSAVGDQIGDWRRQIAAWRATGQAWDPDEQRVPGPFVFVDDFSKRIVGLARAIPPWPFYVRARNVPTTRGWHGYFRSPAKSTVSLYGLRRDGSSVCHVTTLRAE